MPKATLGSILSERLSVSTPPIIVIGMHRSGTSLITWVLERLGLFMGRHKDLNSEALFFQSLNRSVFRIAGATWHQPDSVDTLLNSRQWRELVLAYLGRQVLSCEIRKYLGWRMWMRYGSLERLNSPWGWKDPRNTYALPLWLELFPKAKVIHIRRNGIDVAESLRQRHTEMLASLQEGCSLTRYWKDRHALLAAEGCFDTAGLRCASLEEGVILWQKYVSRAQAHTQALGIRALEIEFENLLVAPQENIESLVSFCGLQYDSTLAAEIIAQLNTSRANAYCRDSHLKTFANEVEVRFPSHPES